MRRGLEFMFIIIKSFYGKPKMYYSAGYFLKNFVWADQRPKVCFIFHNIQLRCEECFINNIKNFA